MRKIRHALSSLICTTLLTLSAVSVLHAEETPAKPDVKAKVETKDGLETVAFDTINGMVQVNLPDDMAASDTISGTVVTEPKKENKEEIASNQDELNGYVVEIVKTKEVKEPVAKQGEVPGAPVIADDCPHVKPKKDKPSGFTCGIAPMAATVIIALISPTGEQVCQQEVPCKAKAPAKPTTCTFPPQGTCEKPLVIKGPCDGRSANSSIKINGTSCTMLAESPRQQICKPPKGCVGTGPIERNEAGKITRGTITMHPAPTSTKIATATPTASKVHHGTGRIFKRTGPFVEQKSDGKSAERCTAVVSGNQITWTRYLWDNDHHAMDKMVHNNLTFNPPPEQLAVGDEFDMTLSLSGEKDSGPMVWCNGEGGRVKAIPLTTTAASLYDTTGPATPTITKHFKMMDLDADIAAALKLHPELASKVTPEVRNSPGVIKLYSPSTGGLSVEIKWLYVPQ